MARRSKLRFRFLLPLAELLGLGALLLWVFCTNILSVAFHPDESQWIATSTVFEPFVQGDRASPLWDESVWTLTQPPATRFLIGLGRRAGGFDPTELNIPWSFGRDRAANIAAGAMPSAELLWWSRLPMAILGAAACLVSFYLLSAVAGRLAGYLSLALLAANPFMLTVLRRAMAEAPLLLSLLVATWIGVLLTLRVGRITRPDQRFSLGPAFWLLCLMGMWIGIAGSLKLSGLTALVGALIVWPLISATSRPQRPRSGRVVIAVGGSILVIGSVVLLFVALNPFLDPDPIGQTIKLITFRANEMQKQQVNPVFVIDTLAERAGLTYGYLFNSIAWLRFPGASLLQAGLWTAGIGYLLRRGWHLLHHDGICDSGIILLIMATTAAGPMLLTPLNWDRYFLLPIWFSILMIAVGGAWLVRRIGSALETVRLARSQKLNQES